MINRRQIKMKTLRTIIIIFFIAIILLMLASIVSPKGGPPTDKAKHDVTKPKMVPIEDAIETFKKHTGQFPNKLEDLVYAPVGLKNVWKGPYLKESQLYDPWDRLYLYNRTEDSYELISYGNDGISGGEGYNNDIYNE
jgi:general secretion pathway protein G